MAKKIQPVIIRRQRKYEAEQAINDVISPFKQQNPQSEVLHNLLFEQRRFKVKEGEIGVLLILIYVSKIER
ncbi:hypothetical protein AKG34_07125 [Peribacillus butanolivorans]|uniref:hypothetical protein n=1 Tax=Peribacillus butanolivorans TaxID=421767 RepID=UPI0006A70DF8|nr:hypothetical protein [Peribacillus butanolivorans]KON68608.1 hypothetical protein AKG34_07125 [Peribacillus butanolivorans]